MSWIYLDCVRVKFKGNEISVISEWPPWPPDRGLNQSEQCYGLNQSEQCYGLSQSAEWYGYDVTRVSVLRLAEMICNGETYLTIFKCIFNILDKLMLSIAYHKVNRKASLKDISLFSLF